MKINYKYFILILVLNLVSCGETYESSIVYSDEMNFIDVKDGYYFYKNKPYTGEVIQTFDDGIISQRENYEDGNIVSSTYYHRNGKLFLFDIFKNRKLSYRVGFFDNGEKKFIEYYIDGKLSGTTTNYFENGKIKSQETYLDGKLNGVVTEHYPNGNLYILGKYISGNPDGTFTKYSENGSVLDVVHYDNGKLLNN